MKKLLINIPNAMYKQICKEARVTGMSKSSIVKYYLSGNITIED